jgi:hypothetical protein
MSLTLLTTDKNDPRVKLVNVVAEYAGKTVGWDKGDPTSF